MIRKMMEEDLAQAARLDADCFHEPWSLEDFQKDFSDNPFFNGIVYEEDGIIKGYATFWNLFETGSLVRIGTDPAFQKQGIGQALLQGVIDGCKEKECEMLTLEVRAGNTKARNLYEKAGFVTLHRAVKYYPDGEDALNMAIGL